MPRSGMTKSTILHTPAASRSLRELRHRKGVPMHHLGFATLLALHRRHPHHRHQSLQSLQWLHKSNTQNAQLIHWREVLEEYLLEITYRPGKLHTNADSLSRLPTTAALHTTCCSNISSSRDNPRYHHSCSRPSIVMVTDCTCPQPT